jgi:hypothetical protein
MEGNNQTKGMRREKQSDIIQTKVSSGRSKQKKSLGRNNQIEEIIREK